MKEYTIYISFGASFDNRTETYELLEKFHQFLEKDVPIENFEMQDIKLGYHQPIRNQWGDKK